LSRGQSYPGWSQNCQDHVGQHYPDKVDEQLAADATLATHDEEFAAATALAATKNYVNVELAEKKQIVKDVKTAQNAKSKSAANTWSNILEIIKNNRAKSKETAAEVYMVGAEVEEIDMEQQVASATAITGPPNTENNVDVETAKKTQVEKAAKTTLITITEALKLRPPTSSRNKVAEISASLEAQLGKQLKKSHLRYQYNSLYK
jgi:hypothetical protein